MKSSVQRKTSTCSCGQRPRTSSDSARRCGWCENDPHIDQIRTEDILGDYPAVRYYPPTGDLYFDIRTRLGEADSFETVESQLKNFEGIQVSVATPAALYRLKRDTVRPIDREVAAALRERFNLCEEKS